MSAPSGARAGAGAGAGARGARGGAAEARARWTADVGDYPADARWSGDGAWVAVACAEGAVLLLDGRTGAVRHRLAGHRGGTLAVAWSAPTDGAPHGVLATAGQDGRARLWNPASGACRAELDAAGTDAADAAATDVTDAAAAGTPPRRRIVPWAEHLAWSPDGARLATAAGREVRLWDAAGRLVRRHPASDSTVSALAWRVRAGDAAGARLCAAGYGGAVLYAPEGGFPDAPHVPALDADGRAVVERRFEWRGSFLAMAWSPDGRVLAAGMQESAIHLWVALPAREVARRSAAGQAPLPAPRAAGLPARDDEGGYDNLAMSGYPLKVRELAWSADSTLLATGGGTHVTVWSFAGKGPAGTRPVQLGGASGGHVLPVSDLACSRTGALIASGGEDGQLLLWDLVRSTRRPVQRALRPGAVSRVAWHPRERALLGAHASGVVTAWEAPR